MRVGLAQPAEEVGALHLLGVGIGETAEVLVAEDPVVGAHALLRADLDAVEGALVHRDEGRDGHLLLEGLGRQEDHLLAGSETLGERGVKRGGRLAGPVGASARRFSPAFTAARTASMIFSCTGRGAVWGKGRRYRPLRPCACRAFFSARQIASERASRRSTSLLDVRRRRGPRGRAPRRSRCRRRRGSRPTRPWPRRLQR